MKTKSILTSPRLSGICIDAALNRSAGAFNLGLAKPFAPLRHGGEIVQNVPIGARNPLGNVVQRPSAQIGATKASKNGGCIGPSYPIRLVADSLGRWLPWHDRGPTGGNVGELATPLYPGKEVAVRLASLGLGKCLERAKGFEPSTPTLARLCSTPELHPHPRRVRRPTGQ